MTRISLLELRVMLLLQRMRIVNGKSFVEWDSSGEWLNDKYSEYVYYG